jgi:cell wall-associated NlpC family hydrolase
MKQRTRVSGGTPRRPAVPPAAIVTLAAVDLRRRPDHRSELRSQLLMGETVRVLESASRGRWWRVENHDDGYQGWVRTWGLLGVSSATALKWRRQARARGVWSFAEIRTRPGGGERISPLFWNGRVVAGARAGRWRRVSLPDGRRGWIESAALGGDRSSTRIEVRLQDLLGTPYLWGGRTPLGFDCSGFVQQVLREQGYRLPRDADQQFRASRRIGSSEEARRGDLVFFGGRRGPLTHVGLMLEGGRFVHAQGQVRFGSLDPLNPLFERRLAKTVRGFGRPARRLVRSPR